MKRGANSSRDELIRLVSMAELQNAIVHRTSLDEVRSCEFVTPAPKSRCNVGADVNVLVHRNLRHVTKVIGCVSKYHRSPTSLDEVGNTIVHRLHWMKSEIPSFIRLHWMKWSLLRSSEFYSADVALLHWWCEFTEAFRDGLSRGRPRELGGARVFPSLEAGDRPAIVACRLRFRERI